MKDQCESSILCKIVQRKTNKKGSEKSLSFSKLNRRKRNSRANLHDFAISQTYNLSLAEKIPRNQCVQQPMSRRIDLEVIHSSKKFFSDNPALQKVGNEVTIKENRMSQSASNNNSFKFRNNKPRMTLPGFEPSQSNAFSSNVSYSSKIRNI